MTFSLLCQHGCFALQVKCCPDIVPGLFWFMIIGTQMISTGSLFTNSPYPFVLNDVNRTKSFRNLEYNVAFR